jgi:hypothetical protein
MADTVRYLMEAMLPELVDLARKGYFTRDEVRAIARKREDFEYALKRRSPVKADFLRCAEYERALDALRLHRRAALLSRVSAELKAAKGRLGGKKEQEDDDQPQHPKMTKAEARRQVNRLRAERDALRRASVADHGARRRAHFAYERATRRFRRDASLWAAWLDYCRETRSGRRLSRVAAKALRAMPTEPGFWVAAAGWEFDGAGDPHAARALMQRGLRECRRDPSAAARMWESYAGMEVAYVRRMRARREVLGLRLPGDEDEDEEEAAREDDAAVEAARQGAALRAAEQEEEAKGKKKEGSSGSRKRRMPRDGEDGEEEEEEEDGVSSSDDDDELGEDEDLEEEDSEDGGDKAPTKPRPKPTAAEASKDGGDQAAADAVLRGAVVRAVVRAASRALPKDLALRLKLARMMDGGFGGGGAASALEPPFPGARRIADELWEGIAADFPASAVAWDARARRAFLLAGADADKAAAAVFEEGVRRAAAGSPAGSALGALWAAYCAFLRERLDAALERVAELAQEEQAEPAGKQRQKKNKAAAASASSAAALAAARRAAALFKACARADAGFSEEEQQQQKWPLPPSFYADTWAGGARAAGQLAVAEKAARLGAERRHPSSARAWVALLDVLSGDAEDEQAVVASLYRALDAVGLPSSDCDNDDSQGESAALASLWERAAAAASPARAASAFARLWASRSRRAGPPSGSASGVIAERVLEALWRTKSGPEAARAFYGRLRLLPPPGGELFRAMARLEAEEEGGSSSALRRARAALEDGAATAYGGTDVRLWLQYAALAELAGKGGSGGGAKAGGGAIDVAALTAARSAAASAKAAGRAWSSSSSKDGPLPTVGDVHFRALRALGSGPLPRLADEFAAAWAHRGERDEGGADDE